MTRRCAPHNQSSDECDWWMSIRFDSRGQLPAPLKAKRAEQVEHTTSLKAVEHPLHIGLDLRSRNGSTRIGR